MSLVEQPVRSRRASRFRYLAPAGLMLLCLALISCDGGQGGASTLDATSDPASIEGTAPTELGDVVWASEIDPISFEPVERRETFSRDVSRVYAVVKTGPLAAGTTLTAAWAFNGQPVEGIDVALHVDAARNAGWVEFHLDWNGAALWPVGNLAVEITASSGESIGSTVEIRGT